MFRTVSRLLGRGALSCSVFCGLLLGLEGGLRLVGLAPESTAERERRIASARIADTNSYRPHPRRFFELRPNYRHSDAHAGRYARGPWILRGRPASEGRAVRPRVAIVGDSCVYGTGLDAADTLPHRIERELLDRGYDEARVEILNYGVPGYSTVQIHDLLDEVLADVRPIAVVLYAGAWNDQTPAVGIADRALRDADSRASWVRALEGTAIHRAVARLVRPRGTAQSVLAMERLRRREPPLGYRVSAREVGEEMRAMIRRCRRAGVALQVVVPAHPRHTLDQHPRTGDDAQTIRRIAREEGVVTLDAPALFADLPEGGEGAFTDFVHLSAEGTNVLARHVASWLVPHLERVGVAAPIHPLGPIPQVVSAFGDELLTIDLPGWIPDDPAPIVLLGGAPLLDVHARPGGLVGRTIANRAGLHDVIVLTQDAEVHVARRAVDVQAPALRVERGDGLRIALRSRRGDRAIVFVALERRAHPHRTRHGASWLGEDARRLEGLAFADEPGLRVPSFDDAGGPIHIQALVLPRGEPDASPMARWTEPLTLRR